MNFLKTIFIIGLGLAVNSQFVTAKSSKSGKNGIQPSISKSGKGTTFVSTQKATSSGKSGKDVTVGNEASMSKSGKSDMISHDMSVVGKSGKATEAYEMSMGKSSKTMSLMMDSNGAYLRGKTGKSSKLSKSSNSSMPN